MPRRLYVIDVAVRDFPAAAETFTQLFGVSGIPMWEDYEPSGGTDGIHFQLGGLDAFGLLSPRTPPTGVTAQRLQRGDRAPRRGRHHRRLRRRGPRRDRAGVHRPRRPLRVPDRRSGSATSA